MMETNDKYTIFYKRYDKIDLTKNILEKKKKKSKNCPVGFNDFCIILGKTVFVLENVNTVLNYSTQRRTFT